MREDQIAVQLTFKKASSKHVTISVRGKLRSLIRRNPEIKDFRIRADGSKGILSVQGLTKEQLVDYLERVCAETGIQEGWAVRFKIIDIDTVENELVDIEDDEAEDIEKPTKSSVTTYKHIPVVKPLSRYKLLLSTDAMQNLTKIQEPGRPLISEVLNELASGEWENWSIDQNPGFISWIEDGGEKELYTQHIPELDTMLIWGRAWSVNLLGNIPYPTGAYYDKTPSADLFAPHIIIYSVRERSDPPAFKFLYDNTNFIEKPAINQGHKFVKIDPYDQLAYSEELYLLSKSRIDDLLNGAQQGLPLHMSEEQVKVLSAPGPILVSGEAGSGKTIIITQWLVINHLRHLMLESHPPPISQLFVTFNTRLRERAQYEFSTMLPRIHRNHSTTFKTYRETIEEIAKHGGVLSQYPKEMEITFEKFMKEYARTRVPKNIDPVLLWDEIRSVIKGSYLSESQQFIDLPSYEKLSESRGHCKTPKELRKEYYNSAREYQNYLLDNGLWDEIDLVKACLAHIDTATQYEKIACDEVQDLAPIEILLLLRLVNNKNVSNLFLTGDRAQVINPSGFQWDLVKNIIYKESIIDEAHKEQRIPDINVLKRNYRSCKEIVQLVNEVLMVRKDILDDDVSKLEQKPLIPSRILPMVLRSSPMELLNTLQSNPNKRLILVKTTEQKQELTEKLGDSLNNISLLTLEEAKGLEYDGVLLWNFFLPRHSTITKNDWEDVFIEQKRKQMKESIENRTKNPYALTYEFNLLHVGLTRARRLLFVFDENEKMRLPLLGENIKNAVSSGESDDFITNWQTSRPSGKDLFNAGNRLLERDTEQAYHFFKLAAEIYEKEEEYIKAAECQEKALEFEAAARLYNAAGDEQNELKAKGLYHDSISEPDKAGSFFMKLGDLQIESNQRQDASRNFTKARDYLHKAKDDRKAAEAALKSADCLPGDRHLDKANLFQNAAEWAKRVSMDDAIGALNTAISEASLAQQSGNDSIQAVPIDAWIAQQYYQISLLEQDRGRTLEGARSAKIAAGLWKTMLEISSSEVQCAIYKESYERAIDLAIKLFIKSDEFQQSINLQKELLKFLTPAATVIHIQNSWVTFSDLYLEQNEHDQYAQTILQLANLLNQRKEHTEALRELKKAISNCKDLNLTGICLTLIKEHIEIARNHGEWEQLASAYEMAGETLESKLDYLHAMEQFKQAGFGYLKADKPDYADRSFHKGKELSSKTVGPTEIGWFCFHEVILEGYLSTSDQYYEYILEWIEESAEYFAQDFGESQKKLDILINGLENEISQSTQKKDETKSQTRKSEMGEKLTRLWNKQGWTETCIAYTLQTRASLSGDDSLKGDIHDKFMKAISSFDKSENEYMIHYLENKINL